MKHFILSALLVCFVMALSAQTSFSDRLRLPDSGERIELRVFPNPAANHIEVSDNELVRQVAVVNLVGRKVKFFSYTKSEQYFIGDLPKGMYLVQLIGDNNKVLTTQRLQKR